MPRVGASLATWAPGSHKRAPFLCCCYLSGLNHPLFGSRHAVKCSGSARTGLFPLEPLFPTFLPQPGKVVVILQGRYAGKKAVIVKNFDEGTSSRAYGHALVLGLSKVPRKVSGCFPCHSPRAAAAKRLPMNIIRKYYLWIRREVSPRPAIGREMGWGRSSCL